MCFLIDNRLPETWVLSQEWLKYQEILVNVYAHSALLNHSWDRTQVSSLLCILQCLLHKVLLKKKKKKSRGSTNIYQDLWIWVDFYGLMVRLNCAANELYHSQINLYHLEGNYMNAVVYLQPHYHNLQCS